MSKPLRSWDDLRPYGIECLTGEACGLGLRILCDVTTKGRDLIRKALGLCDVSLFEKWNSGQEKVGSVMLPYDLFGTLAIFALLDSGCVEVWRCEGEYVGMTKEDLSREPAELEYWKKCLHYKRSWAYRGTAGDRNVHVMSGRVE